MGAVSKAALREELIALLADAEKPMTAGEFTRTLNMRSVDVKRFAVQTALEKLCREGAASYVWAPCQRNGRWVQGRHYTRAAKQAGGDPFMELVDEIEV